MSGMSRTDNMTDPARAWHLEGLHTVLPRRVETFLLQGCLADAETAQQAWSQLVSETGDPKRLFERDSGGLKGLLPFLDDALQRNGVDTDAAFKTYVRVATVREGLRERIYSGVLADVLGTLQEGGIEPIVLRGMPLAQRCYPDPERRHNHGINLLLHARSDTDGAAERLARLDCRRTGATARAQRVELAHPTGLQIELHERLFSLPHFEIDSQEIDRHAVSVELNGTRARAPALQHQMLHVIEHGFASPSRRNLRWICDTALLLRSATPIELEAFGRSALRTGLALPVLAMLDYLRKGRMLDIDPDRVHGLRARAWPGNCTVREGLLAIIAEGGDFDGVRSHLPSLLRYLRFRMTPSRRYLRWRYGIEALPVALAMYALRPAAFLYRRCVAAVLGRRVQPTQVPVSDSTP
jgi:hypothetical protein